MFARIVARISRDRHGALDRRPGRDLRGSRNRRPRRWGGRSSALRLLAVAVAVVVAGCQSTPPSPTSRPSPTAAASAAPSAVASASFSPYGSPAPAAQLTYPQRTVFVQLFEWKWTDVATECEQWLGPHGFAAVQISPPQEHAEIDTATNQFPWWERYQAVSYQLDSRSGTRAEFADMVRRCRAAGVEIYADVLINAMAAGSGTGSAGTAYTKYDYPGLYAPIDFHANPNPAYPKIFCDHSINDFNDPVEVRTCELSGLADLRTEEPYVQDKLASYMADLYGLGVRGYRIDSAKHVDQNQLAEIFGRLRTKIPAGATFFVDQEVSDFGGDAVPKTLYYPTGSVDDFVYTTDITAAFTHTDETISTLQNLATAPNVSPSGSAVVFTDNHDSQRGHIGTGLILSYKRGPVYALASIFMLAYPDGYPRVMSSYVFSDTEAGPPSDSQGHTNSIYGPGSTTPNCGLTPGQWVCEQRWHAIAGMVGFRDFTAGSDTLTDWWSNPADGNQIAFGRGTAGFVVINRSTSPLSQTLPTGLAAGSYCDVVNGDLAASGTSCTGATIAVGADGTARFDVPPMQAVAIHVGTRPNA
jgi:alpha-amylase